MENWKIKLLSGVHSQVEVMLSVGETIIGSDELNADIVISDVGIRPCHVQLQVSDDEVWIENIEATTTIKINQQVVNQHERVLLAAMDIIQIDALAFTLGGSNDVLADKVPESDSVSTSLIPIKKSKKKKRWKKPITVGILLSFIPSALIIWFILFDVNHDPNEIKIAEPIVLIHKELKALKLKDVRVEWNAKLSQAILEGYVKNNRQKYDLLKKIDSLNINYKSNIRTMESIKGAVKFILSNLGYHKVKIVDGKDAGTIVLTGYIDDATRWKEVESIIKKDVPGLLGWKVNLQRASAYLDAAKAMLQDENLLKKLNIEKNQDQIEAIGELTSEERAKFINVARIFKAKYKNAPLLILKSIPKVKPKNTNKIDFKVKAVNFGSISYLVLADNTRYTEGTVLPTGYRIINISEFGVVLEKGKEIFTVRFGSNNGTSGNDRIRSAIVKQ